MPENSGLSRRNLLVAATTGVGVGLISPHAPAATVGRHTSASRVGRSFAFPLLDDFQVGHIRHIQNLAAQWPGDWSHMGGPDDWKTGGTLFKQLGGLYWALALAHFHRLPAAPAVFRETSHRLIQKMLRLDVWHYWKDMSESGPYYDPSLTGPRQGWIDPVIKENIMYSGRLSAMVGMHAMLFDDDSHDQPGALLFDYDIPYGVGRQKFPYSRTSLNERIYWQMVESGFLGISCEPNMTFVVCNQYAILGQRFADIRKGTRTAADMTRSYMAAWQQKGWLNDKGHLILLYKPAQDRKVDLGDNASWDAYSLTFMNSWNRDFVRSLYPDAFSHALRENRDGTLSPWPGALMSKVKDAITAGRDPAKDVDYRAHRFGGSYYDLTFLLPFYAEVGDARAVAGLLAHADHYMRPTWLDGGLYYPRNDQSWDAAGNLTYMDPWCGNGAVAHARLNVPDGLWKMYNEPWTADHFAKPALTELEGEIDILRACHVDGSGSLLLTARSRLRGSRDAKFTIGGALSGVGRWTLYRDGSVYVRCDDGVIAHSVAPVAEWRNGGLAFRAEVSRPTDFLFVRDA